jgi:hypothetical protein
MLLRGMLSGAALAVMLGSAAHGQSGPEGTVAPHPGPPQLGASMSQSAAAPVKAHRTRRRLKPGMVVVDRHGARVGIITRTRRVRDGQPAVQIDVNGTPITVRTSRLWLSRNGEEAIINLTRSQIRTRAILNTY